MKTFVVLVLFFTLVDGLHLHKEKGPQDQCDHASFYEATPRCEELCSASINDLKLKASKQLACTDFWYDNFKNDVECEQNAKEAHAKMIAALCGNSKDGICHEDTVKFQKKSKTRGIVFTARRDRWDLVLKTLKLLPKLQKDRSLPSPSKSRLLPAEILVDSDDFLTECKEFFEGLAKCFAPTRMPKSPDGIPQIRGKWGYKATAVLESSFDEVLFLDEDVVPVHDPSFLFDSCDFTKTGAIFMPDLFGHACKHAEFTFMGQPGWPEHVMFDIVHAKWEPEWALAQEVESGAFFVDKTRHLKALKLWLHFIENPEVQRMVYGDKDALKFAFLALGESYSLSRDRPIQLLMQGKDFPEYNRIGEVQRMKGFNMFTHHLPRPLTTSILESWQAPNQTVMLAEPRGKEEDYSYCPPVYSGYSAKQLVETNHKLACFPKTKQCLEQEIIPPEGVLQDAVDALQYLAKEGF